MSHHFAHVNVNVPLGTLERVHAPFFLVQVVHCVDAGSCSLIVSHDPLGSLLIKCYITKPYMEGGVGTTWLPASC